MSDSIVFTLDCTDRFFELNSSSSPWRMLDVEPSMSNEFFEEKAIQLNAKILTVFPHCTEAKFNLSEEEMGGSINSDKVRKTKLTAKAPITSDSLKDKATLVYVALSKNQLTQSIKRNYQVSNSITYNNITYTNINMVYVLVKEGQSIEVSGFLGLDLGDIEIGIIPGDRPACISLDSLTYCPDHKQEYIFRANILMGSKKAIKNYPIEKAQKMFGIKPKDQKTGMLEFTKIKELKLGFLPTKNTPAPAIGG